VRCGPRKGHKIASCVCAQKSLRKVRAASRFVKVSYALPPPKGIGHPVIDSGRRVGNERAALEFIGGK
jgi:hypothetical protein